MKKKTFDESKICTCPPQTSKKNASDKREAVDVISAEAKQRLIREIHLQQAQLAVLHEELRRAHAAVEASQLRYFDFYNAAPVGYLTLSKQGVIMEANQTMKKWLGGVTSTFAGQRLSHYIDREDVATYRAHVKQLFAKGSSEAIEIRLAIKDAPPSWIRMESMFMLNSEGIPLCYSVFNNISEQKQAERSLSESEYKYKTILHCSAEGFWGTDYHGQIFEVNNAFCDMTGYLREELLGMNIADLNAGEDPAETARQIAYLMNKRVNTFEKQLRRKDGAVIDVEIFASVLPVVEGKMIGFCRDISVRIRMETQLQFNAKMQEVLKEIADASNIAESLESLCRKVHLSAGKVLPIKNIYIAVHEKEQKKIRFPYCVDETGTIPTERTEGKGLTEYLIRAGRLVHLYPDDIAELACRGEVAPEMAPRVEWLGVPLTDFSGTPCGAMVLYWSENKMAHEKVDETLLTVVAAQISRVIERKRKEIELQKSEAKHRTILQTALDGFWIVDRQGWLLAVNEAYCTMTGYTREELLVMHVSVLDVDDKQADVEARIDRIRKNGSERFESRHRRKDGSIIIVEVAVTLLPDDSGQMVCFCRDITEQKKFELVLRESEQLYRAMMHQSSDAISLVDLTTNKIVEVNERWIQMLGYTSSEACSLSVYQIVEDQPQAIDKEYSTISTGGSAIQMRRLRRKDGHIIDVERLATRIEIDGKQILMFANRDVSEERKMQRANEQELKLAATVQRALMPEDIDDVLTAVQSVYVPCKLVSGDFFDYAWSDDHQKLAGFVVDISGHGVTSALQGIAVTTYFREILNSPMRLVTKLNWINQKVLRYFTEDTFAAAIYFEFDFSRKTLRFATAGIYGFLASSGSLPKVVVKEGSLIGLTSEPEYDEWVVPIQPGDAFYFMSDGIFEQSEELRDGNLSNYEETVAKIKQIAFKDGNKDDCSAVCIQIKNKIALPIIFNTQRYNDFQRIRARLNRLIHDLAAEKAGKIIVAVGEALNNAVRESIDVRMKISLLGRLLIIRVRDGGQGFDGIGRVAAYMQSDEEGEFDELLYAEGGRGILIMISWMDKVIYNRQGNEVMLVKRLSL